MERKDEGYCVRMSHNTPLLVVSHLLMVHFSTVNLFNHSCPSPGAMENYLSMVLGMVTANVFFVLFKEYTPLLAWKCFSFVLGGWSIVLAR